MKLHIDLETKSRVNLKKFSVYRYVEDPSFAILMASWSYGGSPVTTSLGHEAIREIPGLFDPDVVKVAHNAAFERVSLSKLYGLPVGQYLPPETYHDTQAVAGEYGYPQGLDALAKALGATPKDTAGTRLINLFCKPNRKGEFNHPEDYPQQWLEFIDYCEQDVETLVEVDMLLGDFPTESERKVYFADQRINDTGMAIDVQLATRAVEAASDNQMVHELEMSRLTGVANPNSVQQMMAWCRSVGLQNKDMQAETIEALLEDPFIDDTVRRVLELRQELALVASKKFSAALGGVNSDGRLRGSFRFFGAHTARWSGRGCQPQNLPRQNFEDKRIKDEDVRVAASLVDMQLCIDELLAGDDVHPEDLKRLVRAMFLFHDGGTVFDYESIEARVIAWLANEMWAIKAFQDHRDIYVETAERMGGLTRAQGKVAVLALGFAGGINSLRAMGAEGDDDELKKLVWQWRRANPNIVRLWGQMEDAMQSGGPIGNRLRMEVYGPNGTSRALHLPSGRAIHYHGFRWERYKVKDSKTGKLISKEGWRYDNPKPTNPRRIGTYGGRMTENAVQAVARDLMAESLVRLVAAGHRPVGHVHDEILVDGLVAHTEMERLMCVSRPWAAGLPVGAKGFHCDRYRKG